MDHPTAHDLGLLSLNRATTQGAPGQLQGTALDDGRTPSVAGPSQLAWHRFRRNPVAVVALAVCALIIGFALAAHMIAAATGHPYHAVDLQHRLQAPLSPGYLLGTDAHGRDVLVRLAYGGRISLLVAGLAATVSLTLGATVGIMAGYAGGAVDSIAMRLVDVLLS